MRDQRRDFAGHQEWHSDRDDVVHRVEENGAVVIGSASCHMVDVARLCHERGWRLEYEAGGVWCIRAWGVP